MLVGMVVVRLRSAVGGDCAVRVIGRSGSRRRRRSGGANPGALDEHHPAADIRILQSQYCRQSKDNQKREPALYVPNRKHQK